jgi:hypothetical protein
MLVESRLSVIGVPNYRAQASLASPIVTAARLTPSRRARSAREATSPDSSIRCQRTHRSGPVSALGSGGVRSPSSSGSPRSRG